MAQSLRKAAVVAAILLAADAGASHGQAADQEAHNLLVLQATARMAADLAAGNHCAGFELKPRIEAARRYLAAAAAADNPLIAEIIDILATTRYDSTPCDTPCPRDAVTPVPIPDEPYGPEATARHVAALNDIVTQWLERAERDAPVLSIAVTRHSHDPLPRYLPSQPVDYLVHVGPSCHGAVLVLDRDYELPGDFDGSGSFIPRRVGLWTIHIKRHDGLTVSPLIYLDDETGLPSYYKEFWVGSEPTTSLGPGGLGPWAR